MLYSQCMAKHKCYFKPRQLWGFVHSHEYCLEILAKKITTYVWPKGGGEYIQFHMSFTYNEKVPFCHCSQLLRPHSSIHHEDCISQCICHARRWKKNNSNKINYHLSCRKRFNMIVETPVAQYHCVCVPEDLLHWTALTGSGDASERKQIPYCQGICSSGCKSIYSLRSRSNLYQTQQWRRGRGGRMI